MIQNPKSEDFTLTAKDVQAILTSVEKKKKLADKRKPVNKNDVIASLLECIEYENKEDAKLQSELTVERTKPENVQDKMKIKTLTQQIESRKRDPNLTNDLKEGHCHGPAMLWAYCSYLGSQPREMVLFMISNGLKQQGLFSDSRLSIKRFGSRAKLGYSYRK